MKAEQRLEELKNMISKWQMEDEVEKEQQELMTPAEKALDTYRETRGIVDSPIDVGTWMYKQGVKDVIKDLLHEEGTASYPYWCTETKHRLRQTLNKYTA